MPHIIWYKDTDPTIVTGIDKTQGEVGESSFETNLVITDFDNDFYFVEHGGPTPILMKKNSSIIATIINNRLALKGQYIQWQVEKEQDIANYLPSWANVEAAIDDIDSWVKLKMVLKKIARIVYWLAKNRAD